ncbi:PaaI family thioesterase [Paenibacillus sp. SC116]|uniref:PaaI family thioesterase n=1 Tax=Paenibacillus sp. SC116 TaxID=2968986 RepID=UPI00215B3803|nr:PaaI family thioesterase [Paenibacillus sp. SC116]MCR8845536.1 PaaI family thioesterase [Paenibacillus sp. SC116]
MEHLDYKHENDNNSTLEGKRETELRISPEEWAAFEEKAESSFWGFLGCKVVSITADETVISLEVGPHHMNMLGIVNGGVSSSLLDNSMGMMAGALRPEYNMVTSNLNIHFVAPLKGPVIMTHAKVLHGSKRTLTCYAEVREADGTVGAIGTATFRGIKK